MDFGVAPRCTPCPVPRLLGALERVSGRVWPSARTGRRHAVRNRPVGRTGSGVGPTVRTRPSSHPEPGNRKKPGRGGGLTDRCSYCSGPPLAPHPDGCRAARKEGSVLTTACPRGMTPPRWTLSLTYIPFLRRLARGVRTAGRFQGGVEGLPRTAGSGSGAGSGVVVFENETDTGTSREGRGGGSRVGREARSRSRPRPAPSRSWGAGRSPRCEPVPVRWGTGPVAFPSRQAGGFRKVGKPGAGAPPP